MLPSRSRSELLLDWYWPALKGAPAPQGVRAEFAALWAPVLDRLLALPGGWFLRDYHSPNLIWLPEREGIARVGIIDFQDALNEHCGLRSGIAAAGRARHRAARSWKASCSPTTAPRSRRREPAFDRTAFAAAYADFGAQRNTRLLGLWLRLLRRDGKPQYIQNIPRTWGYLARNLRAPALGELAAWYDRHFPIELRSGKLPG